MMIGLHYTVVDNKHVGQELPIHDLDLIPPKPWASIFIAFCFPESTGYGLMVIDKQAFR